MGDLILFRPATARRRAARPGEDAKILFFTGVRYERWSEDTAYPPKAKHRSDRNRDPGGGKRSRRG